LNKDMNKEGEQLTAQRNSDGLTVSYKEVLDSLRKVGQQRHQQRPVLVVTRPRR
jgi:hypothetical protein